MRRYLEFFLILSTISAGLACGEQQAPVQTDTPRVPMEEYSLDYPGEWEGLQDEHYPRVQVLFKKKDNIVITVQFPPKHPPDHYIQKIGIMDDQKRDIAVQSFKPEEDFFGATFTIEKIRKGYKAFARCSIHDLWIAPIESF